MVHLQVGGNRIFLTRHIINSHPTGSPNTKPEDTFQYGSISTWAFHLIRFQCISKPFHRIDVLFKTSADSFSRTWSDDSKKRWCRCRPSSKLSLINLFYILISLAEPAPGLRVLFAHRSRNNEWSILIEIRVIFNWYDFHGWVTGRRSSCSMFALLRCENIIGFLLENLPSNSNTPDQGR